MYSYTVGYGIFFVHPGKRGGASETLEALDWFLDFRLECCYPQLYGDRF